MPINVLDYSSVKEGEKGIKIEWLCDGDWELPSQIKALEEWLNEKGKNLPSGSYVADIGFSPRKGALGGGGVLTHESMAIMSSIGMNLFFSEYPAFESEGKSEI